MDEWDEPAAALTLRRERNRLSDEYKNAHDNYEAAVLAAMKIQDQLKAADAKATSCLSTCEDLRKQCSEYEHAYRLLTNGREMKHYSPY